MTRLPRPLAVATAVVLCATLAACGEEEPTAQDPGGAPSSSAGGEQTGEPGEEPTEDPEATASATAPADGVTVPVYFTGETPQGTRLFREFRRVEADNPADEALALLGAGDALDPDYGTLLPQAPLRLLAHDESIVLEADSSWSQRPEGMSDEQAALAVQQVVYTVQGVLQARKPVVFVRDDAAVDVLGLTDDSFAAAPQLDVLALMNVTSPEEGQPVSGSFTASGVGSSFEATVLWQVRDEAGDTVLDGFTTAEGWMDRLYPWEAQVDVSGLAPGTYSFVALTDDPSGGEGGGPTEDSKTITVQ